MIDSILALNGFKGRLLRVVRNADDLIVHQGIIAGAVSSDCGGYATISFTGGADDLRVSQKFAAAHTFHVILPREGSDIAEAEQAARV